MAAPAPDPSLILPNIIPACCDVSQFASYIIIRIRTIIIQIIIMSKCDRVARRQLQDGHQRGEPVSSPSISIWQRYTYWSMISSVPLISFTAQDIPLIAAPRRTSSWCIHDNHEPTPFIFYIESSGSRHSLQINQHNHLHSCLIWQTDKWKKIKKIKTVYIFAHWGKVSQDLRGDEAMCSTCFYSNCQHS